MPKCTHIYDQTISHNHGFADFIRGSIGLFQYCNMYGYSFYIDYNSHPIFKYLKDNKYYSHEDLKEKPVILKVNGNTDHKVLKKIFESNTDINIFTNILYLNKDSSTTNFKNVWPELSEENKEFARTILQPNDYLNEQIYQVFKNIHQVNDFAYEVIHLRFPDIELGIRTIGKINKYDITTIINKIKNLLVTNKNTNYILLCSSSNNGKLIKKQLSEYSNLKYWDNQKVHIGYSSTLKDHQPIIDTLIDFFTMSKSKSIHSFSVYDSPSGFSRLCNVVFNVDMQKLA